MGGEEGRWEKGNKKIDRKDLKRNGREEEKERK